MEAAEAGYQPTVGVWAQVVLRSKGRPWERRRLAVDGHRPGICGRGSLRRVVFVRFPGFIIGDSALHAVWVLRRCTVRTHLKHCARSCFRRYAVPRLTEVELQVLCAWALGRRQRYGEGSFPKPVAETLMLPCKLLLS